MCLSEINQRISDRSECFYWQTNRKISAEEAAIIWKDRHSNITNEELLKQINSNLNNDKLFYIRPFDESAQTSLGNVNSIRVGALRVKRYCYEQTPFLKSMIEKGKKHLEELLEIFHLSENDI